MNPFIPFILLALLLLPACRPDQSKDTAPPVHSSTHGSVQSPLKSDGGSVQSPPGGGKALTIKGSDTMVHLVSSWAEQYMNASPVAQVSVTGGGSGTGFSSLINGTTDICAASRPIQEKERAQAKEKGITPKEIAVARDAIVVIVHPTNPVMVLTMGQTGDIFTGKFTHWDQVGGGKEAIIPLSRESSSGTYVFFQEHVLKKADYTVYARLMPGTSAMAQSVAADKTSIGYTGLGYALEMKDAVKMVSIKKDESAPAVAPSEATVASGAYPISRELYFYTNGEPGEMIKPFIEFCLSETGQQIVRETGYVAVR
jgi:phosphate transport system substrate-binding protein